MDLKRLIELLVGLRDELGNRANKKYAHLFGPSTIRKLSKMIDVLRNDSSLQESTLIHLMNDELVNVFEDAGTYPRKSVHDSVESLKEIRDIVSELNSAANRGAFGGSHEITYLTNDVKAWLTRDIECFQAIVSNRPWREK